MVCRTPRNFFDYRYFFIVNIKGIILINFNYWAFPDPTSDRIPVSHLDFVFLSIFRELPEFSEISPVYLASHKEYKVFTVSFFPSYFIT